MSKIVRQVRAEVRLVDGSYTVSLSPLQSSALWYGDRERGRDGELETDLSNPLHAVLSINFHQELIKVLIFSSF